MSYITPKFPKWRINAAGRRLAEGALLDDDPIVTDLVVINNWRSSHGFPLNAFHVTLRGRARKFDPRAITAQRIKRLSSIEAKLRRFTKMELARMHDIGGCRAIVKNVSVVKQLVAAYKESISKNPKRAEFVKEYNYIDNPKDDGYRCVHLVFRYRSAAKQHVDYNGLRIEVQLRSQMQHSWATAVETVGTFIRQALKSSQGEEKWLRFFALMSTFIAMKERTPLVPNTPSDLAELTRQLREYAEQLGVIGHLQMYVATLLRIGEQKGQGYYLLELDPAQLHIRVTGYKPQEYAKATTDYLNVEKQILSGAILRDAVLVSAKSFSALKRAYPNYFLDTHRFIELVNEAVGPPPSARDVRKRKAH
jgi:hypothetical protein